MADLETQKDFSSLVDLLLSLHQRKVEQIPNRVKLALTGIQFLKEFGTVSVDVGRCSGKTSYIRRVAKSNDLVVVPNYRMKRMWSNQKPAVICSTDSFLRQIDGSRFDRICGLHLDTVWIDEPAGIVDWTVLYQIAALHRARRVVIFGGVVNWS